MSIEKQLIVSSSPHNSSTEDTRSLMLDVLIALVPALILAIYYFGFRALILTLISAVSCIAFEYLYRHFMKKSVTIGDLSAVVTGVLLAFNLPVTAPYWIPVVGAGFAILIVKQLYGGIGKNFINPALAARVFLFSWPTIMNTWPSAFSRAHIWGSASDVVTSATPLTSLKAGTLPDLSLIELLLGQHGGSLGETSALVLMLGGVYLLLRRVISVRIPLSFVGTVALITFLFPKNGISAFDWMLNNVLTGGLMLGAIFMATDYATSPVTKRGQVLYGIGCGLVTVFIRYFGSYADGVSFAILIMNTCVWALDKSTRPGRYGIMRAKSKKGGLLNG